MNTLLQNPSDKTEKDDALAAAKNVFKVAKDALEQAESQLAEDFQEVVDLILNHKGKVVVCGVGKSGYVAQKLAATLCSTGTPAIFMHPAEALHGDLGVYQPGDPTILLSKSGSTAELVKLVPLLKQFNSPLIALVGNVCSPLAEQAEFVLDATVPCEADPLGIVPTTSAFMAMVIGDALASALMHERRFQPEDFARFHPGGQLGRSLLTRVEDVLHAPKKVACVQAETPVREVLSSMTRHSLGAACVLDAEGFLEGIITDGDIRRMLQEYEEIKMVKAQDIMTANPICIDPQSTLSDALKMMEDRPNQLMVLPVVNPKTKVFCGLVRLHDIYQPQIG